MSRPAGRARTRCAGSAAPCRPPCSDLGTVPTAQALASIRHVIYGRLPHAGVSVTKQEPAGAERGGRVDPSRRDASVQDLDPEGALQHLHVQDEQAGRDRPARMGDEDERRRRAARIKRMNDASDERLARRIGQRLDEGMKRRAREVMERRRDWYAQVGIHRAFARDCARYMAGVSC